ncbi:MAG: VanZ family protein [Vicinamibacterales bacterium]
MRRLWLWGPVIAYMAVIFWESSLPSAPLPSNVSDKVAHAIGYAILGALVARAMAGGFPRPLTKAAALASIVLTTMYGASDELHQRFVPGRSADVNDIVADAAGAVVAVIAVWACGILWPRVARAFAASRDL